MDGRCERGRVRRANVTAARDPRRIPATTSPNLPPDQQQEVRGRRIGQSARLPIQLLLRGREPAARVGAETHGRSEVVVERQREGGL